MRKNDARLRSYGMKTAKRVIAGHHRMRSHSWASWSEESSMEVTEPGVHPPLGTGNASLQLKCSFFFKLANELGNSVLGSGLTSHVYICQELLDSYPDPAAFQMLGNLVELGL